MCEVLCAVLCSAQGVVGVVPRGVVCEVLGGGVGWCVVCGVGCVGGGGVLCAAPSAAWCGPSATVVWGTLNTIKCPTARQGVQL